MRTLAILAAALAAAAGCSPAAKPWPELHPVHGSVKVGGQNVAAGYVTFRSEDGANSDFMVSGKVEADGKYTLQTTHALEKGSAARPGAPAGRYRVMFMPAGTGDQVTGASVDPIDAPKPVTVNVGENDLPLDFPKAKK